jgi:hypothetical protein
MVTAIVRPGYEASVRPGYEASVTPNARGR